MTQSIFKGILVEQNEIKFNLWLYKNNGDSNGNACSKQALQTLVNKKFCFQLNQTELNTEFEFLSTMICKHDLKLDDLRVKIINLLRSKHLLPVPFDNAEESTEFYTNKIRLRILKKQYVHPDPANKKLCVEKYRLKKALYDWHKTLKQLNLNMNEIDLSVQILEADETLNQGLVILDCFHFNPSDKTFTQYMEILWNINNGATVHSLKQSIQKEFNLDSNVYSNLQIAKRLVEKFDYVLIKDQKQQPSSTDTGKKSNSTKTSANALKINLKQPPYNLDDGEIVAFFLLDSNGTISNVDSVTSQNFLTNFDMDLKSNQVDLNKLRKNNKKKNDADIGTRRDRRAEIGISIKTDDFS